MNMDNIYTYSQYQRWFSEYEHGQYIYLSQYQRWFSEYEHGQYIYLLSVSEVVLRV